MDRQARVLIAMAEAALGWERWRKRQMDRSLRADQAALQKKRREREMLMRNKQDVLAEKAAKENFVDNFMVFIEAIENNDPEIFQNFDERVMMETILPMIDSDCVDGGDQGGFAGGDSVPKMKLDVEEKPTMDATLAMNNGDGNCGRKGGINNSPENAHNLGEGGMVAAIQGTNSDGSEVSGTAGIGDSCNGKPQ